ncbi:MAG: HNH endonuclease signature motif containing protein [Corynebacterium sp.]|nr:HNH endonuclease signature motif containing protein [Corynebacterium sp.]
MNATDPSFRHVTDDSDYATFQRNLNRMQILFWVSKKPNPEEDFHTQINAIAAQTSLSKAEVRDGLRVGAMLRRFSKLRECIEKFWHVTLKRLVTIEKQVMAIDDSLTNEVDEYLAQYLTPQVPDQVLAQPSTIAKHLRNFIQQLDPDAAQRPKEQAQRVASFKRQHNGYTRFCARVTDAEAEWIRSALKKHQDSETDLIDAFFNLLNSKIRTTVVMNEFRDPQGFIHMLGVGLLDKETANRWTPTQRQELDFEAESDYRPSQKLRTLVKLLDGTCRFPGCTTPAADCELDHVVNYDEGGPTSVENLASLCKFHHNTKTSQRVHYTMDKNRVASWHFCNGTVKRTLPNHGVPMFSQSWAKHESQRTAYRRSGAKRVNRVA